MVEQRSAAPGLASPLVLGHLLSYLFGVLGAGITLLVAQTVHVGGPLVGSSRAVVLLGGASAVVAVVAAIPARNDDRHTWSRPPRGFALALALLVSPAVALLTHAVAHTTMLLVAIAREPAVRRDSLLPSKLIATLGLEQVNLAAGSWVAVWALGATARPGVAIVAGVAVTCFGTFAGSGGFMVLVENQRVRDALETLKLSTLLAGTIDIVVGTAAAFALTTDASLLTAVVLGTGLLSVLGAYLNRARIHEQREIGAMAAALAVTRATSSEDVVEELQRGLERLFPHEGVRVWSRSEAEEIGDLTPSANRVIARIDEGDLAGFTVERPLGPRAYAEPDVRRARELAEATSLALSRQKDAELHNELFEDVLLAVGHDLRGPIGMLQLAAYSAAAPGQTDSTRRSYADAADRAAMRISRQLDAVLSLARSQADHGSGAVVEACLAEVVALITRGDRVVASGPAGTTVNCAPSMLVSVLYNLVSNALRHTGSDDIVTVSWRHTELGTVRIKVRDSGPGVPVELRAYLFDVGTQLASPGSLPGMAGVGLGLVARLVALQQGAVWVTDREDGEPGASFHVDLPAAVDPSRVEPASGPSVSVGTRRDTGRDRHGDVAV